jgi:translation elongation factor EF-Tu-like GTPase
VDPFAIVVIAGLGGLVAFLVLLGLLNEGRSLEQIGLRTSRQIVETREQLDAEDLEQLLAAHNARRRARGEPELTVDEVERGMPGVPRPRDGRPR